jgi:hypothetical protein
LPIWLANYRYRDRLFQVLVNGRNGRVAGDRPWSAWKIVRLVLLILFAILLALILVNKAKGQPADSAQKEFSHPRSKVVAVAERSVGMAFGDADRGPTPTPDARPTLVTGRTQNSGRPFTTRTSDARFGRAGAPDALQALDPKT